MRLQFNIISFISIYAISLILSGCGKDSIIEKEIVTETITVTDTIFVTEEVNVTRFILVRHAEKSSVGNNPNLTEQGTTRAEKLGLILSEIDIDRVYSTNFNRTIQTAMPTAVAQGLTITNYGGFDHDSVIDDVLENVNAGKVLIVGHSDTTPNFLNALTGTSNYDDLDENEYDNLFIVNTKTKGDSEVIHLKY